LTTRYVVASDRPWNVGLAERLSRVCSRDFVAISSANELTPENLARLQPRYVFFAHWSTRIPQAVWDAYECVVFHMTDLPYGRGGSPMQNLIARGHEATVITALRCVEALDAGPIYLKRALSLLGSAEEIFIRADRVIEQMIIDIQRDEPSPVPQSGEPVMFRRRRPEDGDLAVVAGLDRWYDWIRMLDAEGYPPAYLDVGDVRLEFRNVTRRTGHLEAMVKIRIRDAGRQP
jgi:methionyl-tRNA formyltransferase